MRNPFKHLSKDYVKQEIANMEYRIGRMEDEISRIKQRIRDLKKGCGLLK